MPVWIAAAVGTLMVAPTNGFAQQMQSAPMMMHGTSLEGTVAEVRFVSCGATPETCQAIFDVVPTSGEMMGPGTAMASSQMSVEHMMMEHAVTIIVVPGTALMYQGSALPFARVKPGDQVKLEYQTVDDMNIALSLTMTGMGHMGHM
jgi:hypothetical protein